MATHFFTPRPPIIRAVFWDGSNFTEVHDLCSANRPLTDNGDGTITSGGGYLPEILIEQNVWVSYQGMPLSDEYQEVSTEDVQYEVS